MSVWGKLAGIGLGVAGVVTGNPALIGAGASVIGADVASEGAKKASQQQVDAAKEAQTRADAIYDKSSAEQRRIYEESRAGFQPYMAIGAGASGNLGQLIGLPPGATAAPTPSNPSTAGSAVPSPAVSEVPVVANDPIARGEARSGSSYGGKNEDRTRLGALGGAVIVRAPTGETRRMTRAQADPFLARGAQIVG